MIFNSQKMEQLRKKFIDEPNNRVPQIVFLDRDPKFAEERHYLERSFKDFPSNSRTKLLGSLFSKSENQHIGAWFELMLNAWLGEAQLGQIIVEPEINNQTPDFLLDIGTQKIIIEARALTKNIEMRHREQRETDILLALSEIKLPFAVIYKPVFLNAPIQFTDFRNAVKEWLTTNPDEKFFYKDHLGNQVNLSVIRRTDFNKLTCIGSMGAFGVRAEPVKSRLNAKTGKYKKLTHLGYPYIIALYIEPWPLSAEEVVSAWFGQNQYILDIEDQKIVDTQIDGSGIHFYKSRIQHRSVSGTLVFRRTGDLAYPFINAWYVENPYAVNPINNNLFPTESCFIVLSKSDQGYEMGWRRPEQ